MKQNPDIKFLGRVLGDVIRTYAGDDVFRRIEYIRAASVDRHRGGDAGAIDLWLGALDLDDGICRAIARAKQLA